MKFLIFETSASFLTAKQQRPPPLTLTRTVSSTNSISTSSTCSTDHGDDDDDDDWSVDNHEDSLEQQETEELGGRRVRFAPASTTVYHCNTVTTRDEVRHLWYQKSDFQAFKRQTMEQAYDMLQHNGDDGNGKPDAILQALDQAFVGFCHVQTATDIGTVLATCPIPFLANAVQYIGMDRYLVASVVQDRTLRKQRLQQQMTWYQVHRNDRRTLPAQLRAVSRLESQPCRLYAHHVAQCALRSTATS